MTFASWQIAARALALLALSALLESGGDAGIRTGLAGRKLGFVVGAVLLVAYGFVVNKASFGADFGKLMGLYIAVFFVVSQVLAVVVFREKLTLPLVAGGALVVAGGCVLTFWRPA